MSARTAADLVQYSVRRLGRDATVDPGLLSLLATAQSAEPSDPFTAVQQQLRVRLDDLGHATSEMQNLSRSIRRLRRIYPYTIEGWPVELRRLEGLLATDPDAVSIQWLHHLAVTAGAGRLSALRRLIQDGPLHEAHEGLRGRMSACLDGLSQRSYPLAAPLLRACLAMRADHSLSLSAGTTRRLVLVLARLAIVDDSLEEAQDLLTDEMEVPRAARLALRASVAHRRDDKARARALLAEGRAMNARDLDVVTETMRWGDVDVDRSEAMARAVVQSAPCFFDIEHDLEPLLDPPAQLWIAVAERASEDADQTLAERALGRAEDAARPDERARIRGRASGIRATWLEDGARAEELLASGISWLEAGDAQVAFDTFERALRVPASVMAESLRADLDFRRADCFGVLMSMFPNHYSRSERERALDALLAAQCVDGAVKERPWAYGVECDLRTGIAELAGDDRRTHRWGAIHAAARTVARRLDESRAWATLSDATGAVGRYGLASELTRYSINRLRGDPQSLAVSLVNDRSYSAALDLLSGQTEPWGLCVTGWLWCRQGRIEEAANLLETTTIDPEWHWAKDVLVSCHVILGDNAEARRLAEVYLADLPDPVENLTWLFAKAKFFLVLGHLDEAEQCARGAAESDLGGEFNEGESAFLAAVASFLRDGGPDATAELAAAAESRSVAGHKDWQVFDRPTYVALAEFLGVEPDGLAAVDEIAARRIREAQETGAAATLDGLSGAGCDPGLVDGTKRLVRALRALASEDLEVAASEAGGLPPGLSDEARAVLDHVESERAAALARRLSRALLDGDETAAADLLGSMTADGVGYAGAQLFRDIREENADAGAVAAFLSAMSVDTPWAESLSIIREWLPDAVEDDAAEEPDGPAAAPLQLGLPASWFEAYSDPVRQHPVFTRYLPEVRARSPWEIPAVSVFPAEDANPGFVILDRAEEVLDSGDLPDHARWCEPSALRGMPVRLKDAAFKTPVGCWIPDDAFHLPEDWVPWLITMDPAEAAVNRLGDTALRLQPNPDS
jgi:hypothetical protein